MNFTARRSPELRGTIVSGHVSDTDVMFHPEAIRDAVRAEIVARVAGAVAEHILARIGPALDAALDRIGPEEAGDGG